MRASLRSILREQPAIAIVFLVCSAAQGQVVNQIGEMVRLDRSKPVPAREDAMSAWRKRQEAIRSFRFEWTEQQTHPKGWLPNPRLLEREWLNIPGLLIDRTYTAM